MSQEEYHQTQLDSFEEKLILLDNNDNKIGSMSKKEAHKKDYVQSGSPHRAFSAFIFNEHNQLLLQRRSEFKITFPLLWTNSCCSHPLDQDGENEEQDNIGIKKAAIRRINFELNIDIKSIDQIYFLEKIHYRSYDINEQWGEHEIDYILFIKQNFDEVKVNFNSFEVQEIEWVSRDKLVDFLSLKQQQNQGITPWMYGILGHNLFKYWDLLLCNQIQDFSQKANRNSITQLNDIQISQNHLVTQKAIEII